MNISKDEQLTQKHLLELANSSFHNGYPTSSDFLNLNELSLFYNMKQALPDINYEIWGGYESAERKAIYFYNQDFQQKPDFDITLLEIKPLNAKYSDSLTHRDFLGAILNLGIERSVIGDIIVSNNTGLVFCKKHITPFIMEQLYQIKHTHIQCQETTLNKVDTVPSFKEIIGTVSSIRLDAVLSVALHYSRSNVTALIKAGKVFINNRMVESNSYVLKENDILSIRGNGKYIYKGMGNQSKKGRYYITILKYM